MCDTVCASCNVKLLTFDLTLHAQHSFASYAHHTYCRKITVHYFASKQWWMSSRRRSVSNRRVCSQLTITQMKQINKKWLSIFICPSVSQRYSNRPLSHASHVRTDNADDQCVLMLSSPLSVSNRPALWLTAHYLQPNTNNTLQWRVTFRNLDAWLLAVPCVSQSSCNELYMSISAGFLLVDGQCLFHTVLLLFLQVALTHESLHLCTLSKAAQMLVLFLADEPGAALLHVYVLLYEFSHLNHKSEHRCIRCETI